MGVTLAPKLRAAVRRVIQMMRVRPLLRPAAQRILLRKNLGAVSEVRQLKAPKMMSPSSGAMAPLKVSSVHVPVLCAEATFLFNIYI